MAGRRVVISGAGIAGPALAHWLHEYGMSPVVVERHRGVRPGGQTVDLRGAGRTVARRMGIEQAVRTASTGEAVRAEVGNPQSLQYLVMGGVDIESEHDNREGYLFVTDGKITGCKAIVPPVLT
ncbi:FAD-dependent monooxygenase [Catellatospora sp. KI3]|uniref:FAD-dependent monooxygenase n=1 Tax=Catellatospora sp. KI3 TaxID=3041620 RepID=UPI00248231F0|nr:FAD-dependent monooxygenase [Catellatospora sp. KI3]MDI1463344.1 FAD-dependent monooxygenase [Catellatospora sp. KI3]